MHTIVNPNDVAFYDNLYLFTFGAYGSTKVYTYGSSLDDALEEVATWLEEHAPGHLTALDDPLIEELTDKETGEVSDMTYTEAGYLTSFEWWVDDVMDREEIDAHCRWLGEWIEDLSVCTDCVMMIANGEDNTEEQVHSCRMAIEWAGERFDLTLTDGDEEFSTSRCDGCGCGLAGYRHNAVAIPPRP